MHWMLNLLISKPHVGTNQCRVDTFIFINTHLRTSISVIFLWVYFICFSITIRLLPFAYSPFSPPFDPSIRDSGFLISGQGYRIIFINIIRLALGQTFNVNVVVVSVVVVVAMLLQQSMLLLVSLSLLLLLMLLLGPLIIFKDICRYS